MSKNNRPVHRSVGDNSKSRRLTRRDLLAVAAGGSVLAPIAVYSRWSSLWPRRTESAPVAQGGGAVAARADEARLMFAVPAEPDRERRLGRALGAYFDHGTDEQLAPLALVSVECVARDALPTAHDPRSHGAARGAPFVAVLATRAGARVIPFALPERSSHADAQVVADVVREAVAPGDSVEAVWPDALSSHPHVAHIAERAARGERIFTAGPVPGYQRTGELELTEPPVLVPAAIDRFAPGLYAAALQADARPRQDIVQMLAHTARSRIVKGEIPGAAWARSVKRSA